MRPFVSLLCLFWGLLGNLTHAALTHSRPAAKSGPQMPSWEEFDDWLGHVAKGNLRPKRSAYDSYDSYYSYNNNNSSYYDDYDHYHLERSLEDKDYFTSVDVLANKFRRQGLFDENNFVFNVPQQSILPDAIIRVAALGPIVTFAYAFARDWQMAGDIQDLKKRVEDFDGASVNDQAKALCEKVKEITRLQGCSAATPGCQDEVVEPPQVGEAFKWFPQGSDLINKMLAVEDLACT